MLQISLLDSDIDQDMLATLVDFLSESEARRATRLRQIQDQKNYVVAHAALRILLARHLQTEPLALTFRAGRWRKPRLMDLANHGLHFNLSHSGNSVLIAVANHAVGVDIELARPLDYQGLALYNFAPEETARITHSSDFFDIWTAKEAVVKASGRGLDSKLRQFVVPQLSDDLQAIHLLQPNPDLDGLHVARLAVGNGYHAALSTAHHGLPLLVTPVALSALISGANRQTREFME